MRPTIIKIVFIALFLYLCLVLFPIGRLAFTENNVAKSLFSEKYYVKISSTDYDFNVFNMYMEDKGWFENESKRQGGVHIYEKDGKEKRILNTDIKTVFIDGAINL